MTRPVFSFRLPYALVGLLLGLALTGHGAHVYVASDGGQTGNYDSWANAFSNLQNALDYVMVNEPEGANIYLAGDTFEGGPHGATHPDNTVFRLQSVSNIVIRGGYEADTGSGDSPGDHDPDVFPTILRLSSGEGRVLTMTGVSNLVIEGLTIRDGNADNGGALYISESHEVSLASSRALDNVARQNGGAVYLENSMLAVTNSLISGNNADDPGVRLTRYGGGFYVDGDSHLVVRRSIVHDNHVYGRNPGSGQGHGYGGGFYVDGDSHLVVRRSIVRDNHVYGRNPGQGQGHGYGGGLYVASGGLADVRETVITGNSANHAGTVYEGYGGAIMNHGTLDLRNALVVSNQSSTAHSDGILADGDSTLLINCTIADNYAVGVYYLSGTIAITNSIVWYHTSTDLMNFDEVNTILPDVWFSSIGGGQNHGEQGCTTQDPLFADRITYHLQSTEGHYADAYFEGGIFGAGSWMTAASTSPLIDRGDPASDYSREPMPNGYWINMGAYGNTEVASRTEPVADPLPEISNRGATAWGYTTAVLNAEVTHIGVGVPETEFLYWRAGGVTTSSVSAGYQGASFSVALSGLMPDSTYHFKAMATNAAGFQFSDTQSFLTRQPVSDLYVATNGNNTAGTNWSTAYRDAKTAMRIMGSGDTMYMAGHVFADQPYVGDPDVFRLQGVTNVVIRGGYLAGDDANLPGPRGGDAWPTILERTSGNASTWWLLDVTNGVVEHITVRLGNGLHGGGVYLAGSSNILFSECRIVDNIARRDGGGMYLSNSTVQVINSVVSGNNADESVRATRYGGGVYVDGDSCFTSINSSFNSNLVAGRVPGSGQGHGFGGGLYIAPGGRGSVRETLIRDNTAIGTSGTATYNGHGAGIANAGKLLLRNSVLVRNEANTSVGDGFWIGVAQAVANLENVTIADNNVTEPDNVGVWYDEGVLSISNSIVWGHDTDLMNLPADGDGLLVNVGYSLFAGIPVMHEVNGCLNDVDPRFIDPESGNYRLRNAFGVGDPAETSPAIDAGINQSWMIGAVDKDGNSRIMKGLPGGAAVAVDLGAYEAIPPQGSMFLFR